MLLQTNSYIVPRDKRADHARLMRRFRQALSRLGCETFEVYEQVGANWSTGETNGRFVQIMRFRDRRHQLAVQNAERTDTVAQTLIREFCDMVNFPYQQQQGLFAVGFYNSVLPVAPVRVRTDDEGKDKERKALPQRASLSALSGMVGTEEQLTSLTPPQPPEENFEPEPSEPLADEDAVAAPIMDADQDEPVFQPLDLDGAAEPPEINAEAELEEDEGAEDDLDDTEEAEEQEELETEDAEGSPAPVQAVSFQVVEEPAAVSTAPREIAVPKAAEQDEHSGELNLVGGEVHDEGEIGQPIWDDSVFAQAIEDSKVPHEPLNLEALEAEAEEQPIDESESESLDASHQSK